MRLAASLWILFAWPAEGEVWRDVLSAVNLQPEMGAPVILPGQAANMSQEELAARLGEGYYILLEGASPAAASFGFSPTAKRLVIRNIVDARDPKIQIIWEQPWESVVFSTPADAHVFAQERWTGAPVLAGLHKAKGGVLWLAADPGPTGRERFPYLLQALRDMGLESPLSSRRLWVFLDTSYRMRVDPGYMAHLWRRNGIAALHIAAWHYFEPDEQRDLWLRRLIGACHRNRIHVYAWIELPHVSERFWQDHASWREKTASGSDAHLDWRKLMNLRNPDCAHAVKRGVEELVKRFDWDGVNLAELYFESLEGHANPSRFTPMNADIRKEFQELSGFDPMELFQPESDRYWLKNAASLAQFLTYRASLAERIQQDWIGVIEELRKDLPHLDLTLTHVDNLLEPETRDRIGADARRLLPLLEKHDFTFLVEDPATAWSLGPERYPKIAAQYAPLVKRKERLAIDINVVDRYQDVYPTKQQTGVELFRELHLASEAFERVTLYFETSLRKADWPLVGAAASAARSFQRDGSGLAVNLKAPAGVRWDGPALVNGAHWPYQSDGMVWLPAGEHTISRSPAESGFQLLDLNANLKSAAVSGGIIEIAYECTARAFAVFNQAPKQVTIDGVAVEPKVWVFEDGWVLVLPKGQHLVTVSANSGV